MTNLTSGPFKSSSRLFRMPFGLALVSVFALIIFAPVILNMVNAGSDYSAHLFSAESWVKEGFPDRPRPQFLFHALVILLYRLMPGASIPYAGLLLALIYYIVLTVIIFVLVYPLFTGFSAFLRLISSLILTLILMLVGPISIITFSPPNLYFGYVPSHVYHNPTVALLKPFALILFLYACQVFTSVRRSHVTVVLCALVSAFGTMAKPSYAIVIIPALGLLAIFNWWRGKPVNWLLLTAGIALPIAIVLIWQNRYYHDANMGSFIFAPLQVMAYYSPDNLLLKLLLSIAFPLAVLILYYRQAVNEVSMQIGWLGLLVGLSYTYLLAEANDWTDGNFWWSGQIAVFILFVTSTLFLIRQNKSLLAQKRFTPAFIFCNLLLLLHLVGGVALYISSLGSNWRLMR